jgi:hypothetical protein
VPSTHGRRNCAVGDAPFARRAGKSPPQSVKDSLCAPWRNDGARITQSVFLHLKSSKRTCAHSTSRQLRLRDYSHQYWRLGDGGRRLGVLLGTAGGQGINCSDSRGARCGRQLDRYLGHFGEARLLIVSGRSIRLRTSSSRLWAVSLGFSSWCSARPSSRQESGGSDAVFGDGN